MPQHQRRLDATPRGVGVYGDFFIEKAKNAEFWDIEGRRFIDFAGGIAVLNTGHVQEHYGNLVTYFRIKGMVPPSSQGQ